MKKQYATIPEAIEEMRKGNLLIVIDSPERENEGDFYIPTDVLTPENVNTMLRRGGGIVCTAITEAQARRLSLPLMVPARKNAETTRVSFTVSVNAKKGVTTGVSAFDRAHTAKVMANQASSKEDIVTPGHLFGLVAKNGGVLERSGHTEAAIDLARLAGFNPSGTLCEIVGVNGSMAGQEELFLLAEELGIKIVLIQDLAAHLSKNPLPPLPDSPEVARVASSALQTKYGVFAIRVYESHADRQEHVALSLGECSAPCLVRIHSECITGDTLASLRCDCGGQLAESMRLIQEAGSGVLIYLNQEGRGAGLANKIQAYALQEQGLDTVEANHALGLPADSRDYKIAADILKDLGIGSVSLLTNNPEKSRQLLRYGIAVRECVPLELPPNKINEKYMKTKKEKMGHRLRKV